MIYRIFFADMFMNVSLWGMRFLCILYPVAMGTSDKVSPDIVQTKVLRGTEVTFRCSFPFDLDHSNVIVYWWRDGNKTFLQEDSRKLFSVKRGGAYLHILNVTIPDAGTYYAVAKYQQQTVAKNSGVQLIVYASPAPLIIVSVSSEGASSVSLRLQCRTAPFYPNDFNLTWHKNGTAIQTGFRNEQHAKTEGLYEVISSLEETEPMMRGTVYTCQVHHVSNSIPANASYTVANEVTSSKNSSVILIAGCTGGAVIILLLTIMTVKGPSFITSKAGGKRNSVNTTEHEDRKEREVAEDKLTYAALELIGSKEGEKSKQHEGSTVYAETKQSAGDSKLTYAALNLTGSKKTSRPNHKDTSLVYAAVKTSS